MPGEGGQGIIRRRDMPHGVGGPARQPYSKSDSESRLGWLLALVLADFCPEHGVKLLPWVPTDGEVFPTYASPRS